MSLNEFFMRIKNSVNVIHENHSFPYESQIKKAVAFLKKAMLAFGK